MKRGATLRELGEDAVVAAITRGLRLSPKVRAGAGDDCAVIGGPRDRYWQLLKADVVVEGVHFLRNTEPERVGWKALCRAISDIAAMAGKPDHALVTLAVPPEMPFAWVEGLYRGLRRAAARFDVSIVGGETARSPGPAFINVALTGTVERKHCVLRSGGEPGDLLYVTGQLGGSLAGKHLDFTPRLAEAAWLAEHFLPTAMMDVSDGLGADLPRLAQASGCSYSLDEAAVPRTRGCSVAQALADGEDFELLFAASPRLATRLDSAWKRKFPKTRLTRIGELTRATSPKKQHRQSHGYDHFA